MRRLFRENLWRIMVPEVGLGRESHDCQSCFRFFNKSRQEKRRLKTQKHSGDISCLDRTDILQALVKLFQQLFECNGGAREPLLGILKRIEVGRHLQIPWACCGSFSRWAGTIYPRSKQVVAFLVLNCPPPPSFGGRQLRHGVQLRWRLAARESASVFLFVWSPVF